MAHIATVSSVSGMLAWVRKHCLHFRPSQQAQRSTLSSELQSKPCHVHPGRSRPRVARAAHQAAYCHRAEQVATTSMQPDISEVPWWDIELRRLDELLANAEMVSPRTSGALVRDVARLARLRGRTLDAVVSEALHLWAWHELRTLSDESEVSDSTADFATLCGDHEHHNEHLIAARHRNWGEIEVTLSALRVS